MYDDETIIRFYTDNKLSVYSIRNITGYSRSKIERVLKNNNIEMRCPGYKWRENPAQAGIHNKRYTVNSEFFSVPNNLNSYWAGFIAADGNITHDNSVRIALNIKDTDHLLRLRNDIGFNGSIKTYKYGFNHYSRLEIFDKAIINDLNDNFNITKTKTFTLLPPKITGGLALSYIVGYIDGDGYIATVKHRLHMQVTCNIYIANWIKQIFSDILNDDVGKIYKSKSVYCYTLTKGIHMEKILSYLNTIKLPKLDRKWNKTIDYKFIDCRYKYNTDD